jgi:hypothetical protein
LATSFATSFAALSDLPFELGAAGLVCSDLFEFGAERRDRALHRRVLLAPLVHCTLQRHDRRALALQKVGDRGERPLHLSLCGRALRDRIGHRVQRDRPLLGQITARPRACRAGHRASGA